MSATGTIHRRSMATEASPARLALARLTRRIRGALASVINWLNEPADTRPCKCADCENHIVIRVK